MMETDMLESSLILW